MYGPWRDTDGGGSGLLAVDLVTDAGNGDGAMVNQVGKGVAGRQQPRAVAPTPVGRRGEVRGLGFGGSMGSRLDQRPAASS